MAKKTPTVGRPPKSTVAPGIFLRGKTYWLRYSAGGEQIRVSLETEDPSEAIRRADERRGRKITAKKTGRVVGGKTPLDRAIEKYKAERVAAGELGENSATTAAQAVTHFSKTMGVQHPEEITSERLAEYYKKTRKNLSEATAQTYVARVGTFARWHGLRVTTPKLAETPAREIVIATAKVNELIAKATNPELKFILLAGFRAGLRRQEITMARPAWFDLENAEIRIPAKDPVSGFVPKSKRGRSLPLVPEFRDFILSTFPDWKTRKWCLRPEKEMGEWIYRWDWRKLFENFMAKHCAECTPHVMRHSYASHLADHGFGIAQLSAWTGDRIATLEKHYLHLASDAKKAEAAFSGEDPAKKTEELHARMMEFLEEQKTDLKTKLKKGELEQFEKLFGTVEEQLAAFRAGESPYKAAR